jgi:putative ABC transport system substrate-binding protein
MIRRRDFMTLLGGAAAWPLAARAQPRALKRIGVLMNADETDPEYKGYLTEFVQGLRDLGLIEGQNLRIELRWSVGASERSRTAATELLALSPDAILASSTANLTALLRQGPTMPIVFVLVSDPVAQGFVANPAHPGGNITGFSSYEFSIGGKWIDLLKQMVPGLAHIAMMFNPDMSPQSRYFLTSVESVARSLGVEVAAAPVHDAADIGQAMEGLSHRPGAGLIFPSNASLAAYRRLIVEEAARYRLPAIYSSRSFTEIGGLMSYIIDYKVQLRQAAGYIDRILKGEKPGDLPVQGPTKFELLINLRTAKALGLAVPQSLLSSADEVIE